MDDKLFILPDDNVASMSNIEIIKNGAKGIFRPLNWIVLKYEILLSGKNPIGYQLFNIFLFSILGINFYLILNRLTKNSFLALITSLLYVVHPINSFLVNYKTASGLQLHIFFMQVSTIFLLRYVDHKKKVFYLLSLLSYFLGFFCHEIIFILPVYLFLILYFFTDLKLKKKTLLCVGYALPLLFYMGIRSSVAQRIKMANIWDLGISLNQYIATMQKLISWYLSKLLWSRDIIFTWDDRVVLDTHHVVHWGIMGLVLTMLAWLLLKRGKQVYAFAICLLFFGFLPAFLASFTYTSSMKTVAIEPHWFGFTSIGFFLLLGLGVNFLCQHWRQDIAFVVIFLIIVGFVGLTYRGNAVWKNANTFCRYWLNVNSTNGAAWTCLAEDYIERHDKGRVQEQYSSCRDIAYLGWAYHTIGQAQSAHDLYSLALRKDPQCVVSLYGLGLLYKQLNEKEASRQVLATAKEIDSSYYLIYSRLVDVFSFNAEKDDARKITRMLRKINNHEN
ncbi:MAG: tetratricopeptide repeat protein [Candidatus Omnitrophica bacterium]|nr:tetratricopeptide repeat protein [Candidatus Omnitrophota bacterium]